MKNRMPLLTASQMDEAQRQAAEALSAGPRKGVFGPFIAMMRSPELMDRFQRVGEYLRFNHTLPTRLNEFAMLVTARHTTNQFEWAVHHPIAIKAGVSPETVDSVGRGERPESMAEDEAVVYDFCAEMLATHHVSDGTYERALAKFGEKGVVDLIGTVGYFIAICLVMNVAGTPAPQTDVAPLQPIRR